MAKLQDLSDIQSESGRGGAAVGLLLESSLMLSFLNECDAFELDSHEFDYHTTTGSSSAPARNKGGSYNRQNVTSLSNRIVDEMAMHGDALKMDITIMRDIKNGLKNEKTYVEKKMAKIIADFGKSYDGLLFNGNFSDDPKEIHGLMRILNGTNDIPGYVGDKGVYDAALVTDGADHLDVTTYAGQLKFLEMMDTLILRVPDCKGIAMNENLMARINTVARELGKFSDMTDDVGRVWGTFKQKKILPFSDNAIGHNEPDNDSANITTSLYLLAPAVGRFSLVTNSGLYYRDLRHVSDSEFSDEMFEIAAKWKIEDQKRVLRVRNIKM